ncbi:MAG: phenylalanine--tRNA ligase subunit beta [Spirochaetales bacterium]|nr:phenylalanine--tRNA ligase subunit beta [Spirochaetales bacterium]
MPKIEVSKDSLLKYINKKLSVQELEAVFPAAKAELDDVLENEGILKIELNDTNRPDLWSTAGLGRLLRVYLGGKKPVYTFFSDKAKKQNTDGRKVIVDKKLKDIRPYIAGFAAKGKKIDDATLKDIIQTQEKLCWNFGRKRKSIAMGVYRNDLFSYPVRYSAADPDKTRFVPLQMEKELSLREIIAEHPKGREFGPIVADFPLFPHLTGAEGGTLSFPPVINSAAIGAVEIGNSNLFIEMTGTDIHSLLTACSIVACDLADSGFEILPVEIEYPYNTPFGKSIVCPYYFQEEASVELAFSNKMLGESLDEKQTVAALERMGITVTGTGKRIRVRVPEYRNDFLHQVDLVEDVMIGRGMDSFKPEMPSDSTIGRYTEEDKFGRKVKDIMIGLGFQEMIFNYLGSGRDYIEKMNIGNDGFIRIANPMSENFEYVRKSGLPALLQTEAVSANAVYPHNAFEIGKVAELDDAQVSGTITHNSLSFLSADSTAGFNLVHSHISAIMFYLDREFKLEEMDDPRFISGRAARVLYKNRVAGVFGEIHPRVLENWGIGMPCTGAEMNLDILLSDD